MKVAVLCIGDELLDGRVTDVNAEYLATRSKTGRFDVEEIRAVGDDEDTIAAALSELSRYEAVVVSGGLGPTRDDCTRRGAASFAGVRLVEHPEALERLHQRFEKRDATFTENNRRQCRFPDGAEVLVSEIGTADGFHLTHQGADYYFFPGVPREFRWFVDHRLPWAQTGATDAARKQFVCFGRGESDLETALAPVLDDPEHSGVQAGFRAEFPLVEISIHGDKHHVSSAQKDIRARIERWLVGEDETMMQRIRRRLTDGEHTVTVAESCTAGLLGAKLTEISGSSAYFEEGYLTYANDAKCRTLGVNRSALRDHGAVSPQVATQMAAGARRTADADFALAITGIAGPTGGTPDKPVGTVDVALADADGVFHRRCHFPQRTRRQVRVLSVYTAAAALLWHLETRLAQHRWSGPFSYDDVDNGLSTHSAPPG